MTQRQRKKRFLMATRVVTLRLPGYVADLINAMPPHKFSAILNKLARKLK